MIERGSRADLLWRGNQPGQRSFMLDLAPGWTLYQGGFGSGKTWAASRKFLVLHVYNGCWGLVVAPTLGDLWRFAVPELETAAREWGIPFQVWSTGNRRVRFPHMDIAGMPALLMSAEHPDRFAGFEVGHVWIDEGARIKSSPSDPRRDAPTQIIARLRAKRAKVRQGMITTTAEGMDTFVQRDFFDSPKPGHRFYIGKTVLNPELPTDYIDMMKGKFGADLARQYLDGEAVSYNADRAHPTFSRAHDGNVQPVRLDLSRTLHIGQDFNVRPLCWMAGYRIADEFHVVDELVMEDWGQVDAAMTIAHDKGWGKHASVVFHPDRSSKNRSTTGDAEIAAVSKEAVRHQWRYTIEATGVNPPLNPRINHASRMILDATGKRRLKVDPRCTWLIQDMERCARGPMGYDPGPENKRGHMLDALGYTLFDIFHDRREIGGLKY